MINDKLTKSIAAAALDIMKESWPDAASTSIYADKAGKTPISDIEAGSEQEMTDEDANKHDEMAEEDSKLKCSSCGSEDVGDYDGEILCHKCGQDTVTEEDIQEALKKSQPPAEWIHDFVHSKDAKFKGKSKAERINMALGAYYAAQGEVKEGVEEPRAQGEKNFKAAHIIDKKHDVNQDDQSGTEAMGEAKPKLPVGTTPTKGENLDGEVINDEDVNKIKASATSAKAPKATGSKQPGAESAESLKDTTKGGKQSAEAPKASGSKNSGAQSAEKVKNTAPDGKLNAAEPTAKQKGSEPMPKGLKEAALKTLLGEDCMSSFDKQFADDNKKALIQLITGQGTEGIDKKQLTQLNKFISSYGAELKKHLDLPILDDKKKEDVKESLNQQTKPVTEAREKVYFSDLEHKFGANPMPHPGSEPFLVIADNSFYGFKNAQSAKAFVQAVNSVDKEADFVDGPEEVYGPFEIKKI